MRKASAASASLPSRLRSMRLHQERASCIAVSVDAPDTTSRRATASEPAARTTASRSTPGCSKNRRSSAASTACTTSVLTSPSPIHRARVASSRAHFAAAVRPSRSTEPDRLRSPSLAQLRRATRLASPPGRPTAERLAPRSWPRRPARRDAPDGARARCAPPRASRQHDLELRSRTPAEDGRVVHALGLGGRHEVPPRPWSRAPGTGSGTSPPPCASRSSEHAVVAQLAVVPGEAPGAPRGHGVVVRVSWSSWSACLARARHVERVAPSSRATSRPARGLPATGRPRPPARADQASPPRGPPAPGRPPGTPGRVLRGQGREGIVQPLGHARTARTVLRTKKPRSTVSRGSSLRAYLSRAS